jgi:phosphinothricin acetyltransferase
MEISLRAALETDLNAIMDIYNHYVVNSTCTYREQPELLEHRRKWFQGRGDKHPVTVAECEGKIVGWSSISPYHSRTAYRHTVENSVYVHHDWHRRGIGSLLLKDLIQKASMLGHHAIIAVIDSDQTASIALHAKYGFEHVGRFRQIGLKFGRWLDVVYMELLLGGSNSSSD